MKTNIILIRHGEKLEWPLGCSPTDEIVANYVDNHHLSAKGFERAHALVSYFYQRNELREIYKICKLTTVIAQDIDEGPNSWGQSERSRQTIWPLLQYIPNSTDDLISNPLSLLLFKKKELRKLVESIQNGDYNNQTIIITWCHQQLPEIVSMLGINTQSRLKWPKKRFDLTWVVKICDENSYFYQLPQLLLFGDNGL